MRNLPLLVSTFIFALLIGVLSTRFAVFPSTTILQGLKSGMALTSAVLPATWHKQPRFRRISDKQASDIVGNRWQSGPAADQFDPKGTLVTGGLWQFMEHCPDYGCIAVAYNPDKSVAQAWPYRPFAIFDQRNLKVNRELEAFLFSPMYNANPVGAKRAKDGSLIITFHMHGGVFPFGLAIAKLGPDGTPIWSRLDYSHHWLTLVEQPDGDHMIYTPALDVGDGSISFTTGQGFATQNTVLHCETAKPYWDTISVLDSDGAQLAYIKLTEQMVASNWRTILKRTVDNCDPTHLNYVDVVRAENISSDAPAGPLHPGDMLVSMRNISAIGLIDGKTHELKQVYGGNFSRQHSVHHLKDQKILIFDNQGGDEFTDGSRVIEIDLATGKDRRIFPHATTPAPDDRFFTDVAGHISISADRTRLLATATRQSRAYDIDLATGALIATYDHLHDVRDKADHFPDAATDKGAAFELMAVEFID